MWFLQILISYFWFYRESFWSRGCIYAGASTLASTLETIIYRGASLDFSSVNIPDNVNCKILWSGLSFEFNRAQNVWFFFWGILMSSIQEYSRHAHSCQPPTWKLQTQTLTKTEFKETLWNMFVKQEVSPQTWICQRHCITLTLH